MVSFIVFDCGVGAEQKICSTDCLAGCVLLKWREKGGFKKKKNLASCCHFTLNNVKKNRRSN